MTRPEVLVVGAGPHGLTAACYLLAADPTLTGRLAVADPRPWLAAWDARFAALELLALRSACVHHPDPEPYALLDWAETAGRTVEFGGPASAPSALLFADFCRSLVDRYELGPARIPHAVTGLHPRSDGGVDVEVSGDRLRVRSVVLAGGFARRHAPVAAAVHSADVDLSAVRAGQVVVVLGGGLTAGQLALCAAERGARVLLVVRAPLRARLMDVEASWLGAELPRFAALPPAARAEEVRRARPGTVPAAVRDALVDHPRIRVRVGTVARTSPGCVHLDGGPEIAADHIWLGTGYAYDVHTEPLTAGLVAETPVEVVDELPVLGPDLSWGGTSVHLSGGLAALELGPAARGLAGARMAAERYTAAITGVALTRRQYPAPEPPASSPSPGTS